MKKEVIYFSLTKWLLRGVSMYPVVSFQGVMVRLMLVLAPVACILSGISVSTILTTYMKVNCAQLVKAANIFPSLAYSSFWY